MQQHALHRVALQFSPQDLHDSPLVVKDLGQRTSTDSEFFIVLTASCGVDFLAPLRLGPGYIQGIISFGSNSDSPCLAADTPFADLPVLFVFGERWNQESFEYAKQRLQSRSSENDILCYDLRYAALVQKLVQDQTISESNISKVLVSCDKWTFSDNITSITTNEPHGEVLGHFVSPVALKDCRSILWLGKCEDLFFRTCGSNINGIDPESMSEWTIQFHKELTKRLALIEKVKSANTIGIVFTNTLPSVDATLARVKQLLKSKGKNSVLISVIQSADNTKFGNFSEVDAYALSSACTCGSLILKTKAHVPLVSLTELEIALGVRKTFGGLEWNSDQEPDEAEDVVSAAAESENEIRDILEFKDNMKSNWFGLEVAAGEHSVAEVEEGSRGIASSYDSEPK